MCTLVYKCIYPSEMDKSARARSCARRRVCAATRAGACAYDVRICATYTLPYAGWSCESCIHSLTRRLCAKTKASSHGYKTRAHVLAALLPYGRGTINIGMHT